MAPYPQWWLVNSSPCALTISPVHPPLNITIASFSEALLMLYNCSLVSLRPRFTISSYTCCPSNCGNHMPSSAAAEKKVNTRLHSTIIFFITVLFKCIHCPIASLPHCLIILHCFPAAFSTTDPSRVAAPAGTWPRRTHAEYSSAAPSISQPEVRRPAYLIY